MLLLSLGVTASDKALNKIVKDGVVRVGVSGNQPPYVMHDKDNKLMGFDIDLASGLAAAMNVKVEFVEMPFSQLLEALDDKEIDMVLSGMNITAERARDVLFVGPYMMSGKSILTNSKSLAEYSQSEQFNSKELSVVALKGSTSEQFVKKIMPNARYTAVENYDQGVAMVIDSSADVMVADMTICVLSVLQHPNAGLVSLSRPLTIEPVGIAINSRHPGLHSVVNNYLASYQSLGILDKLREKWFSDSRWMQRLPQDAVMF
jgi:polar amino acid transport system substrate-binding protein